LAAGLDLAVFLAAFLRGLGVVAVLLTLETFFRTLAVFSRDDDLAGPPSLEAFDCFF